ncbi:MAG: hypothetical protein E2P02_20860 [Acidobacteria bacterium]|nr:MAG: hypothetical protein E2P02_20860 [Acidobacteriota bacterium]
MMETLDPVLAHYGDEILREPHPPQDLVMLVAMWHYARGLAFNAQRELDEAERELAKIEVIAESEALRQMQSTVFAPGITGVGLVAVASTILRAEIEASKGNLDEAIRIMTLAVQRQEELGYIYILWSALRT